MNGSRNRVRLVFFRPFDEADALEAQARGYLSHVAVELDGNRLYPVVFYEAVRLTQDLDECAAHGEPFVADPGMIVLQDVNLEAMKVAVERLANGDFFDHLQPVTRDQLAAASPGKWPP